MPRAWRLLVDAAADGPFNMGVDEALLATAVQTGLPTLRLYHWRGPWLSLGYAQRLGAPRRARLRAAGVASVRRSTGGQAVLHGADLTYAVAVPAALLPPALRESYERIGAALEAGLAALGVAVQRAAQAPPRARAFDCFAQPAADELTVGGRKLVGSAQRRVDGGVLQHGSIRLARDPEPAREAAGFDPGASTSLAEVGFRGSPEALRQALVGAFERAFDARLEPGRLAADERARASERGLAPPPRAAGGALAAPKGPSREQLAGR